MALNPDLYFDLVKEFITTLNEDPKFTTRFILSGREPLDISEKVIRQVDNVFICSLAQHHSIYPPQYPIYNVFLDWGGNIKVNIELKYSYINCIIYWVLSSVRRVGLQFKDSLPKDMIDLLLKNPNFTKLKLMSYDLASTKLLLESRKFDYIEMGYPISNNLNDINVDTKELECISISLEEILEAKSIKANVLVVNYSDIEFDYDFTNIKISSNFQSLEKLGFNIAYWNIYFDPQRFFVFLEFVNTKFTNLKLLKVDFTEHRSNIVYDNNQGNFDTSLESLRNIVNYEDKFVNYKGKVKVELNHYIELNISSTSKEPVEEYIEKLKKELQNPEYVSWIEYNTIFYRFRKSSNVVENVKLNYELQLTYD